MSRRWLAAAIVGLLAVGCRPRPVAPAAERADVAHGAAPWPEIAEVGVGMDFACARAVSGAVYCWGGSARGQLGDGEWDPRPRPVRVRGVDDATDLSVGLGHSCAVRRSGRVACWGMNVEGELGDGTTEDQRLPVEVLDLEDAVEVAAGLGFTCARRRGGIVVCWGRDIGRNPVDPGPDRSATPRPVEGLEDVVAIAAGALHACALRSDGRALCWGVSLSYAAGPESFGALRVPEALPFEGVRAVAPGHEHSCVLLAGGEVRCWGGGRHGELGPAGGAEGVPASRAVRIEGLGPVRALDAGEGLTCAVGEDGAVRCWGGGRPVRAVPGLGPVVQVAASRAPVGEHGCALTAASELWCWGQNDRGQLGDGTGAPAERAVRVLPPLATEPAPTEEPTPDGPAFVADEVAAGCDQTCARRGGEVFCWGRPPAAKLNPAPPDWTSPRRLEGVSGATKLAAGHGFVCALLAGGEVSCWGENGEGQLGDGTTEWRAAPTRVTGLAGAVDLVADYGRACALLADGAVSCWGARSPRATPVGELLPYRGRVRQLALAAGHRCVLLLSGEVLCQGANGDGQIGNGEGGCRPDPDDIPCGPPGTACLPREICASAESFVPVRDLAPAVQIALGDAFSCALHQGGGVSCWGRNVQGQLGRGTASAGEETWLPAPVVGLDDAVELRAGAGRACALRASGSAVCWGQNVFGELGDRTTQDRWAPSPVFAPTPSRVLSSIVQLSAGRDHGCARTDDGRLWCWGENARGQLGDGTTARHLAPGLVRGGGR